MEAGFHPNRMSRGRPTNFGCDCMPEFIGEDETMPIVKDFQDEQVDLKPVFDMPGLRLQAWFAKLYDLGLNCTLSVTDNGSIGITVYTKPKQIKAYINTAEEALETFEAVMDVAMQRAKPRKG